MLADWYDQRILPHLINCACGTALMQKQRERIIGRAHGRVLEAGFGSGLNLPFYDPAKVSRVIGVDPAEALLRLARGRIAACAFPVELMAISAEALPLGDASVDTVVSTFTLCTLPDPAAALTEWRRVLAPGGELLLAEHGRAPQAGVARWQLRLSPGWSRIAGGCRLDRDIGALLAAAGFEFAGESAYVPGPRIFSFHSCGAARKARP